jgi:hypothetical protein
VIGWGSKKWSLCKENRIQRNVTWVLGFRRILWNVLSNEKRTLGLQLFNVNIFYRSDSLKKIEGKYPKAWLSSLEYSHAATFVMRFQEPRVLTHRPAVARWLGLRVRIPPGAWMFVSCEYCVLCRYSFLQRADPSLRGVLPGRSVCHWVWSSAATTLYTYDE